MWEDPDEAKNIKLSYSDGFVLLKKIVANVPPLTLPAVFPPPRLMKELIMHCQWKQQYLFLKEMSSKITNAHGRTRPYH